MKLPLIAQVFPRQVDYLKKLSFSGKMTQAYCLCGQKEGGQNDLAMYWCAEIMGLKNSHPDFLVIDPTYLDEKNKITVSVARQIKKHLARKAVASPHAVVVILNAENLTTAAANALLKIVEEPQTHSVIIFTTAYAEILPKTLMSRVVKIVVPVVPSKTVQQQIKDFWPILPECHAVEAMIAGKYEVLKIALASGQKFYQAWQKQVLFWVKFLSAGSVEREQLWQNASINELSSNLRILESVLREMFKIVISGAQTNVFNLEAKVWSNVVAKFSQRKLRLKILQVQDWQIKLVQNVNTKLICENISIQL